MEINLSEIEKQIVKVEIYRKVFHDYNHEIYFKDLPNNIQENDIIDVRREEAFYSENNSYDEYTELVIIREREETDDEYNKRILDSERIKEEQKKQRYEKYLKLKSEFESQTNKK